MNRLSSPFFRLLRKWENTFRISGRGFSKTPELDAPKFTPYTPPRGPSFYDPWYQSTIYGIEPRSKYGTKYFVTMIPGGGIGPELMEALQTVFVCAGVPVQFDVVDITPTSHEDKFQQMIMSIRHCGVCVKGNMDPPLEPMPTTHLVSYNMRMRKELDLFINVTHFKSHKGLRHLNKGRKYDLYILRPNMEGEYSMLEHLIQHHAKKQMVVEHLKICSKRTSLRIANFVFNHAKKHNRKKVTGIMMTRWLDDHTSSYFLNTLEEVSKQHPDIEYEALSISAAFHHLFRNPEALDVVVAESLDGGVFGSCLAALLGSRGLVASSDYGDRYAVFELASRSRHSSIAGKGIVNPTAILMCGVGLLEFLKLHDQADLVRRAVDDTINKDQVLTPDVGGTCDTEDFIVSVVKRIRKEVNATHLCAIDEMPKLPDMRIQPTPPFDPKKHMPQLAATDLYQDPPCYGC